MLIEIEVEEILSKIITVEADSEEEALQIVNEQYQNEEIVLSSDNYIDTNFKIYVE